MKLEELVARTEGFSGADIESVCSKAALRAVRRAVAGRIGSPPVEAPVVVGTADLETALKEAGVNA